MSASPRFIKLSLRQLALAWIGLALAFALGILLVRAVPAWSTALRVLGVCGVAVGALVSVSSAEAAVVEERVRRLAETAPAESAEFLPWFPSRWWLKPLVGLDLILMLILYYGFFDPLGAFAVIAYAIIGGTLALGLFVHCMDVLRGRATFLAGPRPEGDPGIWRNPAEKHVAATPGDDGKAS